MYPVTITVVGNVVEEPELIPTRSGVPLARLRIASSSRRFDRDSGAFTQGNTLYLDVRCWRGMAHNVAATLHKGAPVVVHGRLISRPFTAEGPDGPTKRTSTELDATAIGLDIARLPLSGAPADPAHDAGALAAA